ncbi:MAG: hypothetical protein GTO14_12280 [Anaerolineales bacterium]|nr:hypothetical protein [Anaerolineales bacterium]
MSQSQPAQSSTETPSPSPLGDELDLHEANILSVSIEDLGEGQFRFDVTMLHDDDGEAPEFADGWQVEDLDGNLLGRRVLLHSHGTQEFTRSETITIPSSVTTVIVRGHDMRHGYGGQAMRVDLASGSETPFDEGSDPENK